MAEPQEVKRHVHSLYIFVTVKISRSLRSSQGGFEERGPVLLVYLSIRLLYGELIEYSFAEAIKVAHRLRWSVNDCF